LRWSCRTAFITVANEILRWERVVQSARIPVDRNAKYRSGLSARARDEEQAIIGLTAPQGRLIAREDIEKIDWTRTGQPSCRTLQAHFQQPKDMQPELRHLRAFLAVADQGSANRAGATLFRAQSAVSRSIHKLEQELGVKLFERRARGMLLTEYGRALLVRARRVHAEMQRARS
jgi:Bacterial regulatory helix-turn-helix protein, lysR family